MISTIDDNAVELLSKKLEQRLDVILMRIAINHAFWGSLSLQCKYYIEEKMPYHAATDCAGKIFFNPILCAELTDDDLFAVNIHELKHIVYMHSQRQGVRMDEPWNIACDYEVNNVIIFDMGYPMPKWVYSDKALIGKIAEEIYDLNKKTPTPQGPGEGDDSSGNEGQDDNGGNGSGKPSDKQDPNGSGGSSGKKRGKKGQGGGRKQKAGGSGTGKTGPGDEKRPVDHMLPAPAGSESQVKDMISTAFHQWKTWKDEKSRGDMPGSLVQHIEKLLKPQVAWDRQFFRLVGEAVAREEYSIVRPNLRYLEYDILLPTLYNRKVGRAVIHIDSSGSTLSALPRFTSEAAKIASIIDESVIMFWDTRLQQIIRTNDLVKFFKELDIQAGGGGTDHRDVFNEINRLRLDPEVCILLTDGYTLYPEKRPPYPVIWCLTSPDAPRPPWGPVVYVTSEED